MTVFPLPARTTVLEGFIRDLVLAVAMDDLRPKPLPLARVEAISFDGLDLTGYAGTVALKSLELQVKVRAGVPSQATRLPELLLLNRSTRLRLADGSEVVSTLAHYMGATSTFRDRELVSQEANIVVDHWVRGPRPAAWLCNIGGVQFELGNLLVGVGTPFASRMWGPSGLRLAGNYTWYVVGKGENCVVIIDCGGAPLEPERVKTDFVALQFTLGAPLRLGLLTGVDQSMIPVASAAPIAVARGPIVGEVAHTTPPVPPWKERQVWAPAFFAAIARALNGTDKYAVHLATSTYLDSTHEDLDTSYLKLQVALEAYCRMGDPPVPSLVSDPGTWRKWVKEHESEVFAFGANESAGRRLVAKVYQASVQRPSADAVGAAFDRMGLRIPETEMEETLGRHLAAHRFFMNEDEDSRDMSRDLDRVAIVRTLLLAAVAHRAGYGGPIYGWNGSRFGEPQWWPVTAPTELAQEWYACLRPDGREWP